MDGNPSPQLPLQVLRANAFVVADQQGRTRAALYADPATGEAGLLCKDERGQDRLRLGIVDGVPRLSFLEESGLVRMTVALKRDGRPYFNLYGVNGKIRACLSCADDFLAGLSIFDEHGAPAITLEVEQAKRGFALWGQKGRPQGALMMGPGGIPALCLEGEDGARVTIRPSSKNDAEAKQPEQATTGKPDDSAGQEKSSPRDLLEVFAKAINGDGGEQFVIDWARRHPDKFRQVVAVFLESERGDK